MSRDLAPCTDQARPGHWRFVRAAGEKGQAIAGCLCGLDMRVPAANRPSVDERPIESPEDLTPCSAQLTSLLRRWSDGETACEAELLPLLYPHLRAIAARQLARERLATLQPTVLLHEAWLRLATGERPQAQNRAHFYALSARLMRQILVDQGRRRQMQQRHDGQRITLSQVDAAVDAPLDLLDLDRALERLERLSPPQARIVELRYFGGLSIDETAAVMNTSVSSVNRGWRAANTWLQRALAAP